MRQQTKIAGLLAGMTMLALLPAAPALADAPPGSLDGTFGASGTGIATAPAGDVLYGVAAEANGGAVAVGESAGGDLFAELLNASGATESTYTGPAGVARAVALTPSGDVVIAGTSNGSMIVQELNGNLSGSPLWTQTAYAGDSAVANGVAVGSDGSVVAVGDAGDPAQTAAVKYSASGAAEWTEGPGFLAAGPRGSQLDGVAVQPSGDIVIAGNQGAQQLTEGLVAQLTGGGSVVGGTAHVFASPDSGFTSLTSAAVQANGDVVVGGVAEGSGASDNYQPVTIALRVTTSGAVDGTFGSAPNSYTPALTALPSGEDVNESQFPFGAYGIGIGGGGTVIEAGDFEDTGAASDQALWAFTSTGGPDGGLTGGNGTAAYGAGTVLGPDGADEACDMSVDPTNGDILAVGDTVSTFPVGNPCGQATTSASSAAGGYVTRLIGFGPPPSSSTPPPPPPPPPPAGGGKAPTATTKGTSGVGTGSATLSGTVNPGGLATTYHFQYGTTSKYGSSTKSASAGSGSSTRTETAKLGGLKAGETYHYRIVATNADGTSDGKDATFTTAPKLTLSGLASKIAESTAVKTGVAFKLTCAQSCSFTATLSVSKTEAKKAGLGSKALTLGTLTGTLSAGKAKSLTLKLSKTGAKDLSHGKSLVAGLLVSAHHVKGGASSSAEAGTELTG